MDVNQGFSDVEIKDSPTESSWIPITLGKPGPSIQQSICKEKRKIGSSVPFWLNAARTSCTRQADIENGSQLGNSICFQPNAQAQNALDFSQNDSENVRFADAANSSCSKDASSLYFALYNESLMQLKDEAAAAKAQATPRAKSSSIASAFTYPVQKSLFQAESSNPPLADKSVFHESGHQGTFETDQTRGGDLRTGFLNHSVPATPNLTETGNKGKVLDRPNCWVSEAAKEKEDNSRKQIAAEFSQNSSLVIDISCHSMSKTLQENHEPDIGSHETVDIKTPQQKPRRRKHRPKVISADPLKAKRGITKPSCAEKLNVEKRKYVKKTKGSTQGDTPAKGNTQGDTPTEGRSETDPVSETIPEPKRNYTRRKGANEVLDRDQRALGDILSSQNSVVSSQDSIDSVGQFDYKKELRLHNFLEEESTSEYGLCTFLELLQMQEQRTYNPGDRKASALEETRTRSEETGSNLETLLKEAGVAPSTITVAGQAVRAETIQSVAIEEITEEDAEDNLPLSKKRKSSEVGKKKKAEIAPSGRPARSVMDWFSSSVEAPAAQPQEAAAPVKNFSCTDSTKGLEVAKRLNKNSVLPADLETSRALATKDLIKLLHINSAWLRSNLMDLLERAEQQDDLLHLERK